MALRLFWNTPSQILATVLLGWGLTVSVFGQGTVTFANPVPIYDVDGKTPLGPGFLAELYAAAPGTSLEPFSASIIQFLPGPNAGYFFNAMDVAIPGVPDGWTAVVQVVAWRASDGATFAAANHPGGHVGASSIFTVAGLTGGPGDTLPSPPLTGLQSFSLYVVVPEPSALLLGLLGGAALMRWRRFRGLG